MSTKIGRFLREYEMPHGSRGIKGYQGAHIGTLEWNDRWRCWEFVPAPHVGLTVTCLRDMAEHLSRQAPPRSGT